MNDLQAIVKEADVVSFDLVDTLLVRDICRPIDIHRLSHECFNATSGRYLTEELAPRRLDAASALQVEAEEAGRCRQSVTFDAIHERMAELMLLDPTTAALLARSELDTERRLLRANPRMLELYAFAVEQGKQIICVSDTYLPRSFLEEVSAEAGITAVSDLLISCETGTSISDGSSWAEIFRRFPERHVVHVGSDGPAAAAAERHGVEVHHVPRATDGYRQQHGPAAALNGPLVFHHLEVDGFRLKNLHRSLLNAPVAHKVMADDVPSAAYMVGYGALGPLMTGFVQWLHRAAGRSGCDSLCFADPDGRFIAHAYRAWWGGAALPSHLLSGGGSGVGPSGVATDFAGGGGSTRPAAVAIGWDSATARWDGGVLTGRWERPPVAGLCFGVGPVPVPPDDAMPTYAFADGRIEALRSLYDDMLGMSRGFLERCLGTTAALYDDASDGGSNDAVLLGAVQQGALDYVTAFRRLTDGLPSTVAVVDRQTACENMVMVLNFPLPQAERVLDRLRPVTRPPLSG